MEKEQEKLVNLISDEVIKRLNGNARIQIKLEHVKLLMERLEQKSREMDMNSVLAVCGADGNMIAVHVMEEALLVSFDVAMKKAYTAAAVKITTKELGVLAQPGGTFSGVDRADNGKLIAFGGGVPLKLEGKVIGGLGVSGATSEQDHELAMYGARILGEIIRR